MSPAPFFREAGSGPAVVCVHSNASRSGQWRGLIDLLALEAGDPAGAARCFIDFWMGAGSFDPMPERVQVATAESVSKQRLARVLPRVELLALDALGHMGPITHPDKVNELIGGFLERHTA